MDHNPSPFEPLLPPHCTPTTPFLYRVSIYFGTCVPTTLGFISILLGNLSILSWLCAQMPQIYKNYQLKSAAGLSLLFLVEWLSGDLTNLIGGFLTRQATWQVVLAGYYVFVDICLVVQYFWYTHFLPKWREESLHSSGSDTDDDASSDLINSLSPINSSFADINTTFVKNAEEEAPRSFSSRPVDARQNSTLSHEKLPTDSPLSSSHAQWKGCDWSGPSPRTIMYAATLSTLATRVTAAPVGNGVIREQSMLEGIGVVISWCSTLLYVSSRLPQLFMNWRRQSTTGLSPYLFMAAFSGNFFYSSSMLTNPNAWHNFGPHGGNGWVDQDGSKRSEWIANAAPFFLGAFLVLFLDGTMGVQFLLYGEGQEKVVKVRDRRGFSRWQRVSGWMRGWIPSINKEKVVDLAESQRLLSESRELDRHTHHSRYGGI